MRFHANDADEMKQCPMDDTGAALPQQNARSDEGGSAGIIRFLAEHSTYREVSGASRS